MHQSKQLDEVIHSDGDDGGAEGCCGESDEAALPLESEHGEQRPRAKKDAQGDPHGPGVVELFHHLQERGGFVLGYIPQMHFLGLIVLICRNGMSHHQRCHS